MSSDQQNCIQNHIWLYCIEQCTLCWHLSKVRYWKICKYTDAQWNTNKTNAVILQWHQCLFYDKDQYLYTHGNLAISYYSVFYISVLSHARANQYHLRGPCPGKPPKIFWVPPNCNQDWSCQESTLVNQQGDPLSLTPRQWASIWCYTA